MRAALFAGLLFASTALAVGAAAASFGFNAAGVANGHWHLNSKGVAANEKIFVAVQGM
jgi:hypothetical protein